MKFFFNNVSDAVLFLDKKGKIVEANKSASELFACPKEKLSNLDITDIFPSEIARKLFEALYYPKTDIDEYRFETEAGLLDNRPVPVSVIVRAVEEVSDYAYLLFLKKLSKDDELSWELERQKKAFDALAKVTANAVSTLELDELLEKLLTRLIEATDADAGAILLKEGEYLYSKATIGYKIPLDEPFRIRVGEGFAGKIAETRKPYFIKDVQSPDSTLVNPYIRNKK